MRAQFLALPLWLLAGGPAAAQAPAVVEVHLSNFRFTPNRIVLDHGRAYVLRLVNDGGSGHDFTARQFFNASAMAPADRAWLRAGAVEVPGGQARTIRLTAPARGTYPLKCTHRLHKTFGMKGNIIVR